MTVIEKYRNRIDSDGMYSTEMNFENAKPSVRF